LSWRAPREQDDTRTAPEAKLPGKSEPAFWAKWFAAVAHNFQSKCRAETFPVERVVRHSGTEPRDRRNCLWRIAKDHCLLDFETMAKVLSNNLECFSNFDFSNGIHSGLDNENCVVRIELKQFIEIFSNNCLVGLMNDGFYGMHSIFP
jgi:hypothetical protein